MVGANVGVSMPVFWLGLMLQYLFAVTLKNTFLALPPSGRLTPGSIPPPFYETWGLSGNGVLDFFSNFELLNAFLQWRWDIFWDAFRHLILPAVALATIPMAIIARMTRSSLLDALGLDYVRTARAKGLSESGVVVRHALRNSLLPVVTVIGLSLGTLIGGAILTETIFGLSGVGKTVFDAITARDYTVVQGFTLVIAVGFVLVNLFTDVIYTFLDPRVRCPDMTPSIRPCPIRSSRPSRRRAWSSAPSCAPVASGATRSAPRCARARRRSAPRCCSCLVLLAVFAPLIAPYGPNEVLLSTGVKVRQPPCVHLLGCAADKPQHIMGIDGNGRDEFSRIVYGARVSLLSGFICVTIGMVIGTLLGLLAGFYGRWRRQRDHAMYGRPPGVPGTAAGHHHRHRARPRARERHHRHLPRVDTDLRPHRAGQRPVDPRAGLRRRRPRPGRVATAGSCGTGSSPTRLTPLVVQATLGIATAVLEVAALSFLGLGVQPPTAEWGSMLAAERNNVFTSFFLVLFPGIMIMINVLAFNLLGDGLRDALDPRLNK